MNAKELRIGNYVNEKWWNSSIGNFELTLIEISGVYKTHIRCQDDHAYNLEEFEAIPLTEDWLIKLDFSQYHGDYYNQTLLLKRTDDENEWELKIYPNGLSPATEIVGNRIEYVHQLQNLYFALTGDELTVKN